MKRFVIFCIFICVAVCGLSHAATPLVDRGQALEQAATVDATVYPDADSVLVCDYTVESYLPDGTGKSTNEWYEKILTEKGRRNSRTASFWMSISYGDVVVDKAEIIKPDSTAVEIDVAANSRLMTEPGQMDSNIYDPNNKILTLAFPGVEVGDILHLVVTRNNTKARVPNAFSDYTVLEITSPIVELVHEIIAPAELPLKVIKVRDEIGDGVQYKTDLLADGTTRHRWSVKNVPQAFPEPSMPPLHTCAQRLLVSTVPSWEDLSKWYWNLSAPRMAATVPEMQTSVDELVEDAQTREEKIWRVFTYVSQKIRYMGVTPENEAPGYEPHDVCLTFQNKYGVCRDKAALLVVLLRMAGVEAFPVLIHVGERRDPEVPQIYFNHAIVGVLSEKPGAVGADQYILMDPTNENTSRLLPEYLCEKSFLVAKPEGETLLESPALPAAENMASIQTTGTISNGWQYAKTSVTLKGINDTVYRSGFSRMRREDRRLFVERMVQASAPGAFLTDLQITPTDMQDTATPISFVFDYCIPGSVITGGVSVVTLPRLTGVFGYVNFLIGGTGLEKRRFPLETEIPCGVEERIDLTTGFTGGVYAGGGDVEIACPGMSYSQSTVYTGGVLSAETSFIMSKSLYSPEEYLGLRASLQKTEAAARALPLFSGCEVDLDVATSGPDPLDAEKPGDVLVLLEETVLQPENATNAWVETVHVRKKILSYAGKIREGDVKIPYNPAMNDMELVAATVTSPDGSVHEVTALEKNIMDQAWVASAPRYPAGKMLVVNFPGLEVGSTIDYTIRHRCYGAPFQAYTKRFGSFDDIEKQVLTIKPKDGVSFAAQGADAGSIDLSIEKTQDGGLIVVATNMAGIIREDNLPPARHVLKNAYSVGSGVDAWQYADMIGNCMEKKAEASKLASEKAKTLVADLGSVAEKVRAIRDFVVKNIRVNGPTYDTLPLSMLSEADQTLESGYGHAVDVAILLKAMLTAVGIESRFIFVNGDRLAGDVETDFVDTYDMFDTVLVAVDDGDATYYVNDGSQYSELRATGADGLLYADMAAKKWLTLKPDAGYEQCVSAQYTLDVQEDGTVIMDVKTEYYGSAVEGFRRLYEEMMPEDRRRHVLEVVSAYSRSAVLEGEYVADTQSYPGKRSFRMRMPGWALDEGGFLNLRLPGAASTSVSPRYGTRRLPFFRSGANRFDETWTVRFPANVKSTELLPSENDFSLGEGNTVLNTSCELAKTQDGRLEVSVHRQTVLERTMFGPADYDLYMKAALKTQGRTADTVVLSLDETPTTITK